LWVGAEIARSDVEMQCGQMLEQRTDEFAVRPWRSAYGLGDADDAVGDPSAAERYLVHAYGFARSARALSWSVACAACD
jgi:hypothetical protein